MEGIQKLMNEVKVIRFQKDDILIVKVDSHYGMSEKKMIAEQIKRVIPPELHVKVVISTPDTEFEILRRGTQEGTQVNATDKEGVGVE
jgi:hypothetical protein